MSKVPALGRLQKKDHSLHTIPGCVVRTLSNIRICVVTVVMMATEMTTVRSCAVFNVLQLLYFTTVLGVNKALIPVCMCSPV